MRFEEDVPIRNLAAEEAGPYSMNCNVIDAVDSAGQTPTAGA
jgi:hypothetical protein